MAVKHLVYGILPGLKWFQNYTIQDVIADMIAGITVGLTVIPQGLAYAALAGLDPQYGLYSAFMGGVIYALLGSCRQVTIGPTALLALITSRHTSYGLNSGPDYAILLCLLSGIIEFLMAILRLGALVDLISLPVTVGFTSATALIIGSSQLKGLLGLSGMVTSSGSGFLNTIKIVIEHFDKIRLGDTCLGITAIILLLLLRKLKSIKLSAKRKHIQRFFWLLTTGRNALVVIIASYIAYLKCEPANDDNDDQVSPLLGIKDSCPFILTGPVKSGLPQFQMPKFHTYILSNNGTEVEQNYADMLSELSTSMFILPIIAVLGNVAISKAFGGTDLKPTNEMLALSFSNIFGSFVSSMPVTGSFSRSAVNHASGVRTPIGGCYTSLIVLLALALMAPYFQYIPKASLSAIIISAVIFMIEFEVIKPLWRCRKRELLPGAITFLFSLIMGVEFGIPLGVVIDLAFLVYRIARPKLSINKLQSTHGIFYLLVRPKNSSLYFPAIEWLRAGIWKALNKEGYAPVIIDFSNVNDFDFTAARGLGALQKELINTGVPLYLLSVSKELEMILKEATNIDFHNIVNTNDLDVLLEQSPDYESYVQIQVPLINGQVTVENDENHQNHGKRK